MPNANPSWPSQHRNTRILAPLDRELCSIACCGFFLQPGMRKRAAHSKTPKPASVCNHRGEELQTLNALSSDRKIFILCLSRRLSSSSGSLVPCKSYLVSKKECSRVLKLCAARNPVVSDQGVDCGMSHQEIDRLSSLNTTGSFVMAVLNKTCVAQLCLHLTS